MGEEMKTIEAVIQRIIADRALPARRPTPLTLEVPENPEAFFRRIVVVLTEPILFGRTYQIYVVRARKGEAFPTHIYTPTENINKFSEELHQTRPGEKLTVYFYGSSRDHHEARRDLKEVARNQK